MRPKKGYSDNRKLKTAKKAVVHATKINLAERAKFWEARVEVLSVVKPKTRTKK
jgi:hypothetical protein